MRYSLSSPNCHLCALQPSDFISASGPVNIVDLDVDTFRATPLELASRHGQVDVIEVLAGAGSFAVDLEAWIKKLSEGAPLRPPALPEGGGGKEEGKRGGGGKVQAGKAGFKPGSTGSKPGSNGSKPAPTGSKPAPDGSQPVPLLASAVAAGTPGATQPGSGSGPATAPATAPGPASAALTPHLLACAAPCTPGNARCQGCKGEFSPMRHTMLACGGHVGCLALFCSAGCRDEHWEAGHHRVCPLTRDPPGAAASSSPPVDDAPNKAARREMGFCCLVECLKHLGSNPRVSGWLSWGAHPRVSGWLSLRGWGRWGELQHAP